ncbi:MAG: DUF4845 domain-containing protein [Proteobacteria bacterium]|nr:DUF4845 domain-containing protein [Pseudomonadota bacterium]
MMRVMRARQRGMTFWGVLFIFGFIVIVVLFSLRAFPLYNEKMSVISAMNSVSQRPDASKLTTKNIRKYFLRNIEATTNIERFTDQSVKQLVKVIKPRKKGQPRILHVKYQATSPLVAELYLLLEFDERMEIRGPNTGE